MPGDQFRAFFQQATDNKPYPYQEKLACLPIESRLVHIPTGCGKTAAVILAWLWQRKVDPTHAPRRLVYCLPMRVLIEQTRGSAETWLKKLGFDDKVRVHVLMGGEQTNDWDLYPERDAILIGTQDMLLSRALNRGYAMSRYRWPMHFGLLHADCLWVFDEIQLMGNGLATTMQLERFRIAHTRASTCSWWMSATLQRNWLHTVDFDPEALPLSSLEADDLAEEVVRGICEARKPLSIAGARMGDAAGLANEIVKAHQQARGCTLVVVNTVSRAQELHAAVGRQLKAQRISLQPILIHSRFRPPERAEQVRRLLEEPGEHGAIIISTQVVEAGVDVSARTLFTELAPWSSLVQRFGRCNRRGWDNETARVFWVDLPEGEKQQEKIRYPYELADLARSRELLRACPDVSPASLEAVEFASGFQHKWVIRRKDFIELFDTTPDLAGNDIDIDRYVREIENSDVQIFWREWPEDELPPIDASAPHHEELCPVPIGEFFNFIKDGGRGKRAYRWDYLDRRWFRVDTGRIYPGQVYLLHSEASGYSPDQGWNFKLNEPQVQVIAVAAPDPPPEANDDDQFSECDWQSIAEHTDRVCTKLDTILAELLPSETQALKLAARWHDRGKVHNVFQDAINDEQVVERNGAEIQRRGRPLAWQGSRVVAKAPGKKWVGKKLVDAGFWRRYSRTHFRHELASTLAVLQRRHESLYSLSEDDLNLVAYLVAAHHGKVRLSIRSLPGENAPPDHGRFARGVWDGDTLPTTNLGGGVIAPAVTLSLEPMELGLCEQPPFIDQPSWAERMITLRDKLGPCRLAYLEAILRAADMRASRNTESEEKSSV